MPSPERSPTSGPNLNDVQVLNLEEQTRGSRRPQGDHGGAIGFQVKLIQSPDLAPSIESNGKRHGHDRVQSDADQSRHPSQSQHSEDANLIRSHAFKNTVTAFNSLLAGNTSH